MLCPSEEILGYQDEIDAEIESCRPKLRGVYAAYAREGTEHNRVLLPVIGPNDRFPHHEASVCVLR